MEVEEVLYGIIFLRLLKEQCFLAITTSAYYVLYSNVSRKEEEREGVGEREGKWSYNWKMTEESNQHSIYSLSLRWGTYHVPSTIARIQLGIYSLGQ